MQNIDLYRLGQIEAEWEEIEASYRLEPYEAPTNLLAERQKVFDAHGTGRAYDPQFAYLIPPELPERRIRQFMGKLDPDESVFEHVYWEKCRNELLRIECVHRHEPRVISGLSCLIFGQPDQTLVSEAQHILQEPLGEESSDQIESVSAEETVATLQSVLRRIGLDRWCAVVYQPMLAKMAVQRLDKEIRIRAGARFSPDGIRRLIVHEIGVHIFRYENGSQQPIKLFANGFTDYLETEEGLAVYSEQLAGLLEPATLRKYAGRVIAAHLAANHSFSEVFCELARHLDLEIAFDIVARAKRCFRDTSQPGAHTKDIVYLGGFLRVTSHIRQSPEDFDLLFSGKISLRNLLMVRSLRHSGTLVEPKLSPKNLGLQTYSSLEVS